MIALKTIVVIYFLSQGYFIITCWKVIVQIKKYLKTSDGTHKYIAHALSLFALSSIFATILQPIAPDFLLSRIILTINLILELVYFFILQQFYIKNKIVKHVFLILLSTCFLYTLKLGIGKPDLHSYLPLFIFETSIAGSISIFYFIELNTQITENVFDDPVVYIMIGLFFCFGIPLSFYSFLFFTHKMDPNWLKQLELSFKLIYGLVGVITSVCYTIFNFFIMKAFKCR